MQIQRKYEDTHTNKETAKFQGSISTQSKALGFWNWQNVNKTDNWENKHGTEKDEPH